MGRNTSITSTEQVAISHVRALGIDAHSMSAISNVFRVANALRNYSEQRLLKKYGLSFSGFTVLWVLWVLGAKQSHELAAESGIAKSTLTGVMKTLLTLGFVTKTPIPGDRRRVVANITRKGTRTMKQIFPLFNQIEAHATADLTERERTDLARALGVILHTVEQQVNHSDP